MVVLATMGNRIGRAVSQESVDREIARLATARHGVFSRAEALRAGATKRIILRRLATGRWQEVQTGVYRLTGAPTSWRQELLAACLAAGADAVASHRAAGGLWRFAGVEPGAIEISVPRGRRVRRPKILVHEVVDLPPIDVTFVDAIPATTPARTLIDLAAVAGRDAVEEALDDALRRGLTRIPRLRWRAAQIGRRGRPGVTVIRALLDARIDAVGIPDSVLETRLFRLLKQARLPLPECQHEVRESGRLIAVLDFAYPSVRIAIEVDGFRWHAGRSRWERDLARRNELTSRGWRVIHVTSTDIERRPDELVRTIAAALSVRIDPN